MKYQVVLNIMPHPELLDPQGRAILQVAHQQGAQLESLRAGKRIEWICQASSDEDAKSQAESLAKLLINPIIENVHVEVRAL